MPQLHLSNTQSFEHNQTPQGNVVNLGQVSGSGKMSKMMDLEQINQSLTGASATDVVKWAAQTFPEGLIMTTSFGIQSAVMLHLVTSVIPDIPVVWIDTGYLPEETYRFAEDLA